MAHGENIIRAERITPIEAIYRRHDREGRRWPKSATIEHDSARWLIARDAQYHGRFHLRAVDTHTIDGEQVYYPQASEPHGYIYSPIHASMEAQDIEGASYAFDDGTHWHFAHCSPHEQIDLAASAEQFAFNAFMPSILASKADALQTDDKSTRIAALYMAKDIKKFAMAVGRHVHATVVGQALGHYHKDPHHDHRRDLAVASIDAVLALWKEAAKTDTDFSLGVTRATAAALAVRQSLSSEHEILWRVAHEKRLKEQAIKAGADPVDGYEYVYTRNTLQQAITGAANLPDPNWPFDALRTGPRRRGPYAYTDGEPEANGSIPWVIRFKRPIPEGTQPGASIGSVAWEQEPPYKHV